MKFSGLFPLLLPPSSYLILKDSTFWKFYIQKPVFSAHLLCGKNFSTTYIRYLVSDILLVFREVFKLNFFNSSETIPKCQL